MAGTFVTGCGGDDNGGDSGMADGAPDSTGGDSTMDTGGGGDAKQEATTDTGPGMDSTMTDTGPDARDGGGGGGDGGREADAARADGDAAGPMGDGGRDGGGPDADAGGNGQEAGDAGMDAPDGQSAAIQAYSVAYAQAYCMGNGKCCPGYPSSFDLTACESNYNRGPAWENTLPTNTNAYSAGHLIFNATKGAACLAALQAFNCNPDGGTVTAADYATVTNACLGVLTGTIANGSSTGCYSSFECANGYCNLPTDGGQLGTCTALVGSGNTCSAPVGSDTQSEQCSQAGQTEALWCNRLAGGATGTCVAPLANGQTCYDPNVSVTYFDDYGCTTLLCGDDALCGDPATYPPPGFCAQFPGGG